MDHSLSFAICAYKDSPYLEEAILSSRQQTLPVEILIATSTPSDHIRNLAAKYQIPLFINPEKKGIASDWNFALSCTRTKYAAIIHQDDIYFPDYAVSVYEQLQKNPDALIAFTDYGDLLPDGNMHAARFYLMVKRFLLWAFYLKNVHRSRMMKRSAVAFGNAICCPAVTYHMERLKDLRFDSAFSVNLDWNMWLRLSELPGAFVYVPRILMGHRIADTMETAAAIADHRRYQEDLAVFESIWGKRTGALLMKLYQSSYRSN